MHMPGSPSAAIKRIAFAALLFGTTVVAGAADIENGRQIYQLHCVTCHGFDGAGVTPGTPDFRRGEGLRGSDVQIARAVRDGSTTQPSFAGILKNRELLDVVAHLRTLF